MRITATVEKTEAEMKQAGKQYDVKIYDGAGHGFMRAGEPEAPKMRMFEANVRARKQSWERAQGNPRQTLRLFRQLSGPRPETTVVRGRAIRPISDDFFGFFGRKRGAKTPKKSSRKPARGIFSPFQKYPVASIR